MAGWLWERPRTDAEIDADAAALLAALPADDRAALRAVGGAAAGAAEAEALAEARRFSKAHGRGAAAALGAAVAWRRENLPVDRAQGAVAAALSSRRFALLGLNAERRPVIAVDWMWGRFLDGVSERDALAAFLAVTEDADALRLAAGDARAEWVCVNVGGPPPIGFARAMSDVAERNFPERLHRSIIYPIPWLFRGLVNGMLWFVPQRIRAKFVLLGDEPALLRELGLPRDSVPPYVRCPDEPDAAQASAALSGHRRGESGGDIDAADIAAMSAAAAAGGGAGATPAAGAPGAAEGAGYETPDDE